MAWGTPTVGTMVTGTGNPPSLSPGAPSGSGGILLLLSSIESSGYCLAPSGWTLLRSGDSSRLMLYGRIADGTASDTPTVTYSTTATANAMAQMARVSGGPTTLDSIVDASASVFTSAESAGITVPTLTPTVDNCLCIFAGYHKNTIGPSTANPFSSTLLGEASAVSFWTVWSYEIQTTKTTRSGGSFTGTSTGADDTRSIVVALVAGVATSKFVKLLAHSSAASATGVEGVVLNAARDTVIGEFTGQAFESGLESGEAVLLIPVEDISPDGSTLTTSDAPLVSAYNSTNGTVGLGSATVIEV